MTEWRASKKVGTILGLAGTLGNSLGQLALPPLIISWLGGEMLGLWQLVISAFFLTLLAELGVGQGVIRILSDSHDQDDAGQAYQAARKATWLVSAAYLLFLVVIVAWQILAESIPPDLQRVFILAMAILGIWGMLKCRMQLRTHWLMATGQVGSHALVSALVALSRPLLACLALVITGHFIALPIAYLVAEGVAYASAYRLTSAPGVTNETNASPYFKRIVAFGLGNGVSGLAGQAANYLQPILIATAIGLHGVTTFTCSLTSAILAQRLMNPAIGVWYPSLIGWRKTNTQNSLLPAKMRKFVLWGTTLSLGGGAAIGILNYWFVSLWVGADFYAGTSFSWLSGAQIPLFFLGGIAGLALTAYAPTSKPIALLAVCELIAIVTLSLPALYLMKLDGLLILLTAIRAISLVVTWHLAKRSLCHA